MTGTAATERTLDPISLAVIANRFETIVRDMTNTLLRTGNSALISVARDFSCSIITAENELLASAEGLPVHILGSHLQAQSMCELHDDLAPGDAYLDNDPYVGNTHQGDHAILVPVFVEGEHLFTVCVKAHQADCGNSAPTTYMPYAEDLYEEGALTFPCVRVQRDYADVEDIVRMCRRRIRVPDQWYGDFCAMIGAGRIGERGLNELATKYGVETIKTFVREWFDYSELCMTEAIKKVPSGTVIGEGYHDPYPAVPEGIPVKVEVHVDAEAALIEIDLRDNVDAVPAGLNLSRATATANAIAAVFNVLDSEVPHNSGSFRRFKVQLREDCVVGIPVHPTCVSLATMNVAERLMNTTQAAFSELGEGDGLAQGGGGMGVHLAVVSGNDRRHDDSPYINQMFLGNNGGPAAPSSDGWLTWFSPSGAGLLYLDSIEVVEQKYPLQVRCREIVTDSGGAGRSRGGAAARVAYGPRFDAMTVMYTMDGHQTPAKGVRGGQSGNVQTAAKIDAAGAETPLSPFAAEVLEPGEWVTGVGAAGGGYGDPFDRDPDVVRWDVLNEYVSVEAAQELYGVVLTGSVEDESLKVDVAKTEALRRRGKEEDR